MNTKSYLAVGLQFAGMHSPSSTLHNTKTEVNF